MKVVGYSQPQPKPTVAQEQAKQNSGNKPQDGNKPQGNKPNGNKPQDGNKPQGDAANGDAASGDK